MEWVFGMTNVEEKISYFAYVFGFIRDYHGFGNPCGLRVGYTGVGVGVAFL